MGNGREIPGDVGTAGGPVASGVKAAEVRQVTPTTAEGRQPAAISRAVPTSSRPTQPPSLPLSVRISFICPGLPSAKILLYCDIALLLVEPLPDDGLPDACLNAQFSLKRADCLVSLTSLILIPGCRPKGAGPRCRGGQVGTRWYVRGLPGCVGR